MNVFILAFPAILLTMLAIQFAVNNSDGIDHKYKHLESLAIGILGLLVFLVSMGLIFYGVIIYKNLFL